MLCQNFQTVVLPYRTRAENPPTLFPGASYHPEIPEPYSESIYQISGMFFDPSENGVLGLLISTAYVYWPSYQFLLWKFSADDGSFISVEEKAISLYLEDVFPGADGDLWANLLTGDAYLLNHKYELLNPPVTPATFGMILFRCFMFDRVRNVAVISDQSTALKVDIRNFTTGTLIKQLRLPESPVSICHAGDSRVYILLANRQIVCLDYLTYQFFEAVRLPQITNLAATDTKISYDKRYQRLLVVEKVADNVDGTCNTRIYGYRNVPQATHVCKPIPLARPREGIATPVLLKQIGDLGEGISGLIEIESTDTNAQVINARVPLDGDGEGIVNVLGLNEGSDTLSISSEVDCIWP